MPTYQVNRSLRHDGEQYGPGTDKATVEMPARQAVKLLASGVLSEAPAPAKKGADKKDGDKKEAK
jgi:hypothetical protein